MRADGWVEREFDADKDYLKLWIKPTNVIVSGQKTDKDLQKLVLAIVDY